MDRCRECGEQISRLTRRTRCAVCERAHAALETFGEVAPLAGRRALRAVKVLANPQLFPTRAHYLNELGNDLLPVAELYRIEVPDFTAVTFAGEQ